MFGRAPIDRQVLDLHGHDLRRADTAMQHRLIQENPEISAGQHRLAGQPDGDLGLYLVSTIPAPGRQNRPRVVLGLQQPGDQQRLPPAQDRRPRLDLDPVREPPRDRPVRLPRDRREPYIKPVAQIGEHHRDPARDIFRRRTRPSLGLDNHGPVKSQPTRELILTRITSGQPRATQLLAQPHAEVAPGITVIRHDVSAFLWHRGRGRDRSCLSVAPADCAPGLRR